MKAMIRMNARERQQANKEIRNMVAQEIEKERADIATRAMYLALIACQQVGLSARTLRRIQKLMTGCVAEKYQEYRNDQLADLWAQVTLQEIGVEVEETKEKL